MFLPKILLALVCATSQVQGEGFRVVAGAGGGVPEAALETVREMVGEGLERLAPRFPGEAPGGFVVVVHRSRDDLPEEVAVHHHPGSPGLALLGQDEIHLLLRESAQIGGAGMRGVVDHELVHILLHHSAGDCAKALPRWLHEGLAQSLAGDTYLGASEEELLYRVRTDSLMRWSDLRTGFPDDRDRLREAYGQSFSFVDFLVRRVGLDTLLAAARHCPDGLEFGPSLVRLTGHSMLTYDEEWRDYLVHDSGAVFRILLNNCFAYLMILAAPILALAVIRRLRSDRDAARRMARQEQDASGEGGSGEDGR